MHTLGLVVRSQIDELPGTYPAAGHVITNMDTLTNYPAGCAAFAAKKYINT
jgi:hypothetical protein